MGAIGAVVGGIGIAGDILGFAAGDSARGDASEAAQYEALSNTFRNKEQLLSAQRERENSLTKERQIVANTAATAANTGVNMNDSAVQAGMSSTVSQVTSNIGFGYQEQAIEEKAVEAKNKAILAGNAASNESQKSNEFFSIGSQVGGLFSAFG
jgi:hypothetical protein